MPYMSIDISYLIKGSNHEQVTSTFQLSSLFQSDYTVNNKCVQAVNTQISYNDTSVLLEGVERVKTTLYRSILNVDDNMYLSYILLYFSNIPRDTSNMLKPQHWNMFLLEILTFNKYYNSIKSIKIFKYMNDNQTLF